MMKRYRRTALSQYIIVGLILLGIAGFGVLSNFVMTQIQFEDHFAIPWAAGRMWLFEGENPYSSEVIDFAVESVAESKYLATLPESESLITPLINLIFYLPFSLLPYSISRTLWGTGLILIGGLIGYLSLKLSGWKLSTPEFTVGILFTILWFPSVNAILTGQLSPVIVLLMLAGIYLIRKKEDTTAGFILALTVGALPSTILLTIFIIIFSISQRRWSILSAYFSGAAFLVIVSILMLPSWPMDWARVIIDRFVNFDWIQTPIIRLAAMLPGITNFLSISLHAIFVLYFFSLIISIAGKSDLVLLWKIDTILVISFLMHVQASVHHLLILIPALFMVFCFWSERWPLWGRRLSWITLISMGAGSWIILFQEIGFINLRLMPLFAIFLAFCVLFAMLWSRWWGLTIPKLPMD